MQRLRVQLVKCYDTDSTPVAPPLHPYDNLFVSVRRKRAILPTSTHPTPFFSHVVCNHALLSLQQQLSHHVRL